MFNIKSGKNIFYGCYISMRIGINNYHNYQFKSVGNSFKDTTMTMQRTSIFNTYPNVYYPLIGFKGLSKNNYKGADRIAMDRFPDICCECSTRDDFYRLADERSDKIISKDYGGRSDVVSVQRKAMLDDWMDYLTNENKEYSPAEKLLIFDGITKDLKPDNDNIPPVLNKAVLAQTFSDLEKKLVVNFNFQTTYLTNLRKFYMEEYINTNNEGGDTKWIIIPSQKNDPDNFEKNVEKLQMLSYHTWCTKSKNARPYLEGGNFHIYLENGQPKLGVRFEDDKIAEVQGQENNSKISLAYLDIFDKHVKEGNYVLSNPAKVQLANANDLKEKVDVIKQDIAPAIKSNDFEKIFNYFGIETNKLEDGTLELSHFDEPKEFTYADLGINEDNLFKNVTKIKGDAKFCRSTMTNLRNLKEIGGNANFGFSKFKTLGKLEKVGGNLDAYDAFYLEDLGNVGEISGDLNLTYTKIKTFNKLKNIGGSVDFDGSFIDNLGTLEVVGGDFKCGYYLKDLGDLKNIGGDADFTYSNMDSLGNLERIEGNADFSDAKIKSLNKLEYIGGDADFRRCEIENYGSLKTIEGKITAFANDREQIMKTIERNNGEYNQKETETDKKRLKWEEFINEAIKKMLKK